MILVGKLLSCNYIWNGQQYFCGDCPSNSNYSANYTCVCNKGFLPNTQNNALIICQECNSSYGFQEKFNCSCQDKTKINSKNQTICQSCGYDQYQLDNGSCVNCPKNNYYSSRFGQCVCFGWLLENSSCMNIYCDNSSDGVYIDKNQVSCVPCPQGTHADADYQTCYCDNGTAFLQYVNYSCNPCPPNSNPVPKSSLCNCADNFSFTEEGTCVFCPNGTYIIFAKLCLCNDPFVMGDNHCVCQANSYFNVSTEQCQCIVGFVMSYQSCVTCPPNSQYSNGTCKCSNSYVFDQYYAWCLLCNQYQVYGLYYANGTCHCANSSFLFLTFEEDCFKCPENANIINDNCSCQNGVFIVSNINRTFFQYNPNIVGICIACAENISFFNNFTKQCQCQNQYAKWQLIITNNTNNTNNNISNQQQIIIYQKCPLYCHGNFINYYEEYCIQCPQFSKKIGNSCKCSTNELQSQFQSMFDKNGYYFALLCICNESQMSLTSSGQCVLCNSSIAQINKYSQTCQCNNNSQQIIYNWMSDQTCKAQLICSEGYITPFYFCAKCLNGSKPAQNMSGCLCPGESKPLNYDEALQVCPMQCASQQLAILDNGSCVYCPQDAVSTGYYSCQCNREYEIDLSWNSLQNTCERCQLNMYELLNGCMPCPSGTIQSGTNQSTCWALNAQNDLEIELCCENCSKLMTDNYSIIEKCYNQCYAIQAYSNMECNLQSCKCPVFNSSNRQLSGIILPQALTYINEFVFENFSIYYEYYACIPCNGSISSFDNATFTCHCKEPTMNWLENQTCLIPFNCTGGYLNTSSGHGECSLCIGSLPDPDNSSQCKCARPLVFVPTQGMCGGNCTNTHEPVPPLATILTNGTCVPCPPQTTAQFHACVPNDPTTYAFSDETGLVSCVNGLKVANACAPPQAKQAPAWAIVVIVGAAAVVIAGGVGVIFCVRQRRKVKALADMRATQIVTGEDRY